MHIRPLVVLAAIPCIGCGASIEQSLLVDTIPEGASCAVLSEGVGAAPLGFTPARVTLTRTATEIRISCSKPGIGSAVYVDRDAIPSEVLSVWLRLAPPASGVVRPVPAPTAPVVMAPVEDPVPPEPQPTSTVHTPVAARPTTVAAYLALRRTSLAPILDWPLRGEVVTAFGPAEDGTRGDGIDIAGSGGALIGAADAGQVVFAGAGPGNYGSVILIRHRDGWISAYAGNATLLIRQGASVERGQPIARLSDESAELPILHFELRLGTHPVDPLDHLPPVEQASRK